MKLDENASKSETKPKVGLSSAMGLRKASDNRYCIEENAEKIVWQRVKAAFLRYGLKEGKRDNLGTN